MNKKQLIMLDKLLDTIMNLASYNMYYKYDNYKMLFATIESKIHFYIFHNESIKNIDIFEETNQIKELIENKELDCIEFYNMLAQASEMLKNI